MKYFALSAAIISLAIFALAAPSAAHAALPPVGFPYWGPLLSCTASSPSVSGNSSLPPCQNICDLLATAQRILYFIITIAIFIIAPIMFVWGGVLFITSMGSAERIASGRKMITAAVIGVVLVMCSFLIVNTFFYLAAKFPGSTAGDIKWSEITCTPQ